MKKKEINSQTQICQKKDIYLTALDEDCVMMDLETGNYYVLNSMASIIWDKIHKKISVGQLVKILLEDYNVEPEICKNQVIEYLDRLQQINLIMIEN